MIIKLTAYAEAPRVEIVVSDMPAQTARVSITRQAGSLSWMVRANGGASIAGTSGLVPDYEPPVGVPLQYRIVAYNAAGAQVDQGTSKTVTLPPPRPSFVWLSDPLDQNSPMLVRALAATDEERGYSADVAQVFPAGQRYGRLSVGQRRALPTWQIELWATGENRLRLRELITNSAFLLVRTHPQWMLPPLLFGAASEAVEKMVATVSDHPTRWMMTVSTSRGPALSVVQSTWTYDDLQAYALRYNELADQWPTYIDLARGPVDDKPLPAKMVP